MTAKKVLPARRNSLLPGVLGGLVGVVILESVGRGGSVAHSLLPLLFGLAALTGVVKSGTA